MRSTQAQIQCEKRNHFIYTIWIPFNNYCHFHHAQFNATFTQCCYCCCVQREVICKPYAYCMKIWHKSSFHRFHSLLFPFYTIFPPFSPLKTLWCVNRTRISKRRRRRRRTSFDSDEAFINISSSHLSPVGPALFLGQMKSFNRFFRVTTFINVSELSL